MSTRQLDRALNPNRWRWSAQRPAGSTGRAVLHNIVSAGFAGALHLVNPRHYEIAGRQCFNCFATCRRRQT